jgi:tripartite ATP-independent transporter DctP family solute receptor
LPNRAFAAAEFQYKLGTDAPAGHPVNSRLTEATDAIREATGGRVDIQVFPNNQLGSSTDMLSQVRSGAIEFQSIPASVLTVLVPATGICGLGFAFKDYDTVWRAMDGELGSYIRSKIDERNLVAMDRILDNGFREITTGTKPIQSPADLEGFKIRVPVSAMWTSLFTSLKASPTSINFAELYSSLQTRIVDGQENALPIINSGKLYEVQKYCSVTNHMGDGYWIIANKGSFEALPEDLRAIVSEQLNAAAVAQRVDIEKLSSTLRPQLEQAGLSFNQPDVAPFRQVLTDSGFYREWKSIFGDEAWEILEGFSGKFG